MNEQKLIEYGIFDALPGALIEMDFASQQIIYMNRIAFAVFGYSPSDIKRGIPAKEIFLNAGEFDRALEIIKSFGLESYETHTPYTRHEKQDLYDFMLQRKGGESFYGECQGSFVLDQKSVPTGLRMYIRDLTDQRLMEASLRSSEDKYRTLVESSKDMIFLFDESGKVLSANTYAIEVLNLSPEEIINKNLDDIIPAHISNPVTKNIKEICQNRGSKKQEITIKIKGRLTWISASFNCVNTDRDKAPRVLVVGRDVTEEKEAKDQLEKALIEAENANIAKDQFISNMSHEFRTPLTSIIGFTDYLKNHLEAGLGEKEKQSFDSIYRNSNRLLRTVNAILSFSQVQTGTIQLDHKIIYLNSFIKSICDGLRPGAITKGLELEFISKTNDDKITMDEYSIHEAFDNIIQNAIKYTNEGKVTVVLKRKRKHLIAQIIDTGIGISEEYNQQLFQPFSQASEGLAREYQGVGLGLALTKRYLDWNNVSIEVKSKKGHGSTFTLSFPQEENNF